MKTPEV